MTPASTDRTFTVSVSDLARGKGREVDIMPDSAHRKASARDLGLRELCTLRLAGRFTPLGRSDWRFEGRLTATVVQACVVTLAPVVTRIDEPVTRSFIAGWQEPEGDEVELPEDVDSEPLGQEIDLGAVMFEALALALPAWPRAGKADGAADGSGAVVSGETVFTAPGKTPMRDEDARPFAALAALRDKLAGGSGESEG